MLSPKQSKAARAWLDWSQKDLADKASVSLSTVRDFEKGSRTPIANNLTAMQQAIEAGDEKDRMELLFEDGQAVGIKRA